MTDYKWNDKFTVNVQIIDEHHKHLISLINRLRHSIEDKSANSMVDELLSELNEYVNMHFESEEEYMIKYRYPDFTSHVAQHTSFMDRIVWFVDKVQDDRENITEEIFEFLTNWLFHHVCDADRKLGRFLQEKGVAEQ